VFVEESSCGDPETAGVYDLLLVQAVRIALVVLGLALALYGIASLTGGWLGEPPWWSTREHSEHNVSSRLPNGLVLESGARVRYDKVGPGPGREWISAGVVVAGLALACVAGWPSSMRAKQRPK
jgi:hypothetical protein